MEFSRKKKTNKEKTIYALLLIAKSSHIGFNIFNFFNQNF